MNKLKELYAKRQVFIDYKVPIPNDLKEDITKIEKELLGQSIDNIYTFLPLELSNPIDGKIIFGIEYSDGKLTNIYASTDTSIVSQFTISKNSVVNDNEDAVNEDTPEDNLELKRSSSIGFTVKFADGKTIKHPTARQTMIEALKYMGLEKASQYKGDSFKGFPLVGKLHRHEEKGRIWQKKVNGWWIYVNMSNARAIACIKGVAEMLNISIEIINDDVPVND